MTTYFLRLTSSPRGTERRAQIDPETREYVEPSWMKYTVPVGDPARVRIAVYDTAGRQVRSVAIGQQPPGLYEVEWDGRAEDGGLAPAGVYFFRTSVGASGSVSRLVLVR